MRHLKLRRLADSRLEHVLIALRDGDRAYNVRDVLDPWWCFERGYPFVTVRRDGTYADIQFNKPCAWKWRSVLPQFDALSAGAAAIIGIGESAKIIDRKRHPHQLSLIVDHSVPLRVICDALWEAPQRWTIDSLRNFLNANFRRAVISYEEDDRLNEKQLASAMPAGWHFGDDPLSRYHKAAITLIT